jgi:hypothetical protein
MVVCQTAGAGRHAAYDAANEPKDESDDVGHDVRPPPQFRTKKGRDPLPAEGQAPLCEGFVMTKLPAIVWRLEFTAIRRALSRVWPLIVVYR